MTIKEKDQMAFQEIQTLLDWQLSQTNLELQELLHHSSEENSPSFEE
ncbi:MAG: hypothetical protein JNK65_05215 [Deltaproteobacteria bacterium]|nr:hypothetical protein [Deltaproteobacteria bacterium]